MSDSSERVIVVGGGVIGAACAYYLSQAGRRVTLLDQGTFGNGCSHGNCGYICPSHVLPLAGPGVLRATLQTLLSANSPLKVRWRFDPAMWRWFWQFARKCNQRDMLATGQAMKSLLASSCALYDELFESTLTAVEWERRGLLFVFRSQAGFAHYQQVDKLLRDEFDLAAARFDADALLDFEPALKPGSAGAWFYQADGQLRPDKLMLAWRRVLEQQGVEIREHCAVQGLVAEKRLVRRVVTAGEELAADHVVIATGAWTPKLRDMLRCPIPIQPGKGYSLTMPRPTLCPKTAMIFEEHRVAITPFASAYRIGSTMEFAGYDVSLNPNRFRLLRDGAALYLREPVAEPLLESWYGWRPMTPDSLPFIGRLPKLDNVLLAAGHGMLGISTSPATGRLIAEIITGQSPHLDPRPYAVDRML